MKAYMRQTLSYIEYMCDGPIGAGNLVYGFNLDKVADMINAVTIIAYLSGISHRKCALAIWVALELKQRSNAIGQTNGMVH